MLAKQIRLNKVLTSGSKLSFKGFILKLNDTILDTDFTIVSSTLPSNGSLNQFIIKPNTNYSSLQNIEFDKESVHSEAFEIVIEFTTPIEFDNIQCVCGDDRRHHFTGMVLSYKESSNDTSWKRFNIINSIPDFKPNDVSDKRFKDIVFSTSYNIYRDEDDVIRSTISENIATNASEWTMVFKNREAFSTGKHFVEITLENSNRITGSSSIIPLWVVDSKEDETLIGNFVYRSIHTGMGTNGPGLHNRLGTTDTILQLLTTGFPNDVNWPEYTAALLVDLDIRKIKMVYNGVYESDWHDIPLDRPDQSFYFGSRIRNGGRDFKYTINYPPKYEYPDLTPKYKTDHFLSTEGWTRNIPVTLRESSRVKNRSYIDWPHTLKDRGILRKPLEWQVSRDYLWRIPEHEISQWGYGYFKGRVLIDYPPKEPTSKRVILYSIRDNENQQITWSDPLTGEYEFKYVKMNERYLIFTYDSDEDHNAEVIGPVYPTLMPEFEGTDMSIKVKIP